MLTLDNLCFSKSHGHCDLDIDLVSLFAEKSRFSAAEALVLLGSCMRCPSQRADGNKVIHQLMFLQC